MGMETRKFRYGPPLFGLLLVFSATPAMSANVLVAPEIKLEERWDSNIQNTSDNTLSDYVLRASPRLTLSLETSDFRLNLLGGIDYERYSKHDEFNGQATTVFDLNTVGPLRFTPRFSVTPTIRYVQTKDSVRRNELTASPIEGLPPSETIVTVPTKSRETSAYLHMDYLVSPNVDFGLGGGGTKRVFIDEDPSTVDSKTLSGNTSLTYRITPRTSTGIYLQTDYNTFENDTDSRSYGGGLIYGYLISQEIKMDAKVGYNELKENLSTGSDKTRSPSAELTFTYTLGDFRTVVYGSYMLAGGGSFGVTTHRGTVQVTMSEQFAKAWGASISSSYQTNKSLDSPASVDVYTWSGYAGLRYQPAEWAAISLTGNIDSQRSRNNEPGLDIDRKYVVLSIDLKKSYQIF